ncbi:MAG: ABC transporter permease [Chloroflexi bacterium]|nr:ABC transporter permease [Chloroflexota bacterium]
MTIVRKELTDQFRSKRYIILFLLVAVVSLVASYSAGQTIREVLSRATASTFVFLNLFTTSGDIFPSFFAFISFLGPIVGIALGFDAINSEQTSGTLSRVIAQPIYRDSFINGKFLAGLSMIGLMLLTIFLTVGAFGLWLLGVAPTPEEVIRIGVFFILCMVYIGFWMGLAILFSIFFKRPATSALGSLATWVFMAIFLALIANMAATNIVSAEQSRGTASQEELLVRQANISNMIMRASPGTLFEEASSTVLSPMRRTLGPILARETVRLVPSPLPLDQSLILVWPQLSGLIALTAVCFGFSYIIFMRREVRAT